MRVLLCQEPTWSIPTTTKLTLESTSSRKSPTWILGFCRIEVALLILLRTKSRTSSLAETSNSMTYTWRRRILMSWTGWRRANSLSKLVLSSTMRSLRLRTSTNSSKMTVLLLNALGRLSKSHSHWSQVSLSWQELLLNFPIWSKMWIKTTRVLHPNIIASMTLRIRTLLTWMLNSRNLSVITESLA